MALDIEEIKKRIKDIEQRLLYSSQYKTDLRSETETTTLGIIDALYGERGEKWKTYLQNEKLKATPEGTKSIYLGVLRTILGEIEMGLVGDYRKEIEAEIFADFVSLAKRTLEENKDVSAVLACAALEDALKRLGIANGLSVEDKDMSQVIDALKREGLLKGAQAKVLRGYVTLRNKTFHAEWDKIEKPEVSSAIGFTEQFLLKHFD